MIEQPAIQHGNPRYFCNDITLMPICKVDTVVILSSSMKCQFFNQLAATMGKRIEA
jgi:hypothetical protein